MIELTTTQFMGIFIASMIYGVFCGYLIRGEKAAYAGRIFGITVGIFLTIYSLHTATQ